MTRLQAKVTGDGQVLQVLGDLMGRLDNTRPLMLEIGEEMVERTKQRFDTLIGPDGQPWAANTEATFDHYINQFGGSRKKDGTLSRKGQQRRAGKKPLTGETRALRTTINYQLTGQNTVRIGTPMDYGRWMQEGTPPHVIKPRQKKALAFGGIVVRKVNHPGTPARPFLGFSEADRSDILDIVRSYLIPAQNP